MKELMYQVETRAFCGMTLPHGEYEDLAAAKQRVEQRVDYLAKLGCEVLQLDDSRWEVLEPEYASMVPDYCGVLAIRYIEDPVDDEDDEDDFEENF